MEEGSEKIIPEVERITASAIRLGEDIYTGNTHIDALMELEEDYPNWLDIDMKPEDGFLTSAGRFVERDEAGKIARKAKQLDHLDSNKKRDASDFLDAHDIEELKLEWLK